MRAERKGALIILQVLCQELLDNPPPSSSPPASTTLYTRTYPLHGDGPANDDEEKDEHGPDSRKARGVVGRGRLEVLLVGRGGDGHNDIGNGEEGVQVPEVGNDLALVVAHHGCCGKVGGEVCVGREGM